MLSNVNNLIATSELKLAQPIIIPLLETNFYKTSGISNRKEGFHEVFYFASNDDNIETICSKFLLQSQTFAKWNQMGIDELIQPGQKLIIGWIKLNELKQTAQPKISSTTATTKPLPNKVNPPTNEG